MTISISAAKPTAEEVGVYRVYITVEPHKLPSCYLFRQCRHDIDVTLGISLMQKSNFLTQVGWPSGLRRCPVDQLIAGSNPAWAFCIFFQFSQTLGYPRGFGGPRGLEGIYL